MVHVIKVCFTLLIWYVQRWMMLDNYIWFFVNALNLIGVQMFHFPRYSMYGIFTYIYHKNYHYPNVGKYTSPIECLGLLHFSLTPL